VSNRAGAGTGAFNCLNRTVTPSSTFAEEAGVHQRFCLAHENLEAWLPNAIRVVEWCTRSRWYSRVI